jgi:hypothetical protein
MTKPMCPECSHENIQWDFACHTWPGGLRTDGSEQWMSCQNCDSAIRYSCHCWLDDEDDDPEPFRSCQCSGWDYTHGLNPRNPRWEREQAFRPAWLEGREPFDEKGNVTPHPNVPDVWSTREERNA